MIIPTANARHLMLDERVIAAVREGRFRVWAVDAVDQGMEILTGVAAGEQQSDGSYPQGTIHRRVHDRLRAMAHAARKWGREPADGTQRVAADTTEPTTA